MSFIEAVAARLLSLARQLMEMPELEAFAIGGIKVDILLHAYPLLREIEIAEGLRLVSAADVAAMKINAVTNRGSKKDFIDLLILHERGIALSEPLDLFCRKYGSAGKFLAIRSLSWFDDADEEPDPVFLNGWTWDAVRSRMRSLMGRIVA